jgi:hypothetical protein
MKTLLHSMRAPAREHWCAECAALHVHILMYCSSAPNNLDDAGEKGCVAQPSFDTNLLAFSIYINMRINMRTISREFMAVCVIYSVWLAVPFVYAQSELLALAVRLIQ